MSKLLALLLTMMLVFSLVACGSDTGKSEDEDEKQTSTADQSKDSEIEQKEPTDAEIIVGEWLCKFDMSKKMGECLTILLGDESLIPNKAIYMKLSMKFDKKSRRNQQRKRSVLL